MLIRDATLDDWPRIWLWKALGFEVLATIPEGFLHPEHGYVGLHVMYRRL